jgi:hypothetical protein
MGYSFAEVALSGNPPPPADHVTVLSVLVDAKLAFPARSCTAAAGMLATTVPAVVIPETLT